MSSGLNKIAFFWFLFYLIEINQFSDGATRLKRSPIDEDHTFHNGSQNWGGSCRTGKKQSPINIKLGKVIYKNFPSFQFDSNYKIKQKFLVKNNGHTIHVTLQKDTGKPTIYGGGLNGKFLFEQLHFHWESEHEFDGKRGDLEMHLVHYNAKYHNFAEALKKSDGIVVLAVLFDRSEGEGEKDGEEMEKFVDYIKESVFREIGTPPANSIRDSGQGERDDEDDFSKGDHQLFSLRDLLPREVFKFFRYDGSLTTPDCNEVVQWTVFINRFFVSNETLVRFRTLRDHHEELLLSNYRPRQSLNSREVYLQITNQGLPPDFNQISVSESDLDKKLSFYSVSMCFLLQLLFNSQTFN